MKEIEALMTEMKNVGDAVTLVATLIEEGEEPARVLELLGQRFGDNEEAFWEVYHSLDRTVAHKLVKAVLDRGVTAGEYVSDGEGRYALKGRLS